MVDQFKLPRSGLLEQGRDPEHSFARQLKSKSTVRDRLRQAFCGNTMDSSFADNLTTVPMADFALKWRFTDPKFDVLPPIHLEQIQPLSASSAELIWKIILDSNVHAVDPFKPGFFRHHETTAIGDSHGNPDEDSRVRKWLYRCEIPFDHLIFLSWQPSWAVKTTWKMLVKYWTSFYYPISDDLTVIDQSLEWGVLFHHEHELHFGTNRPRVATDQSGERTKTHKKRKGHVENA